MKLSNLYTILSQLKKVNKALLAVFVLLFTTQNFLANENDGQPRQQNGIYLVGEASIYNFDDANGINVSSKNRTDVSINKKQKVSKTQKKIVLSKKLAKKVFANPVNLEKVELKESKSTETISLSKSNTANAVDFRDRYHTKHLITCKQVSLLNYNISQRETIIYKQDKEFNFSLFYKFFSRPPPQNFI